MSNWLSEEKYTNLNTKTYIYCDYDVRVKKENPVFISFIWIVDLNKLKLNFPIHIFI